MLTDIKGSLATFFGRKGRQSVLTSSGRCPACATDTTFVARNPWLRDNYLCSNCACIPRERALMAVVEAWFPQWREWTLHESSPVDRGASKRFRQQCANYIPSQFFADKKPGSSVKTANGSRYRNENLEALTFADASIDLHISQDVMEHVFNPSQAFREIARTLKPGGAHVFTVPLVNRHAPSKVRARLDAGGVISHIEPPEYHGNPISATGSLVTMDWGFDICAHIYEACGLFTHVIHIDDLSRGIRAELIEVLVTVKPASAETPRIP
jgi:SAM-dependent methyltransferase